MTQPPVTQRTPLATLLWLLVALSLIPAAVLVARRVKAEGSRVTVTMVMDEAALAEQARVLGKSSLELASEYQDLGLNGIALYEDTFESAAAKGRIALLTGPEALNLALSRGEAPPEIPIDSVLVSEVVPEALEWLREKNPPGPQEVTLFGRT